jgi:hypothetical protein
MPQGLRLDAAYTKLVKLERLPDGTANETFSLAIDHAAAIARYVERTRVVHVIRLGLDGTVLFANEATGALCGMSARDVTGTSVFTRLTDPDADRLRAILAGRRLGAALSWRPGPRTKPWPSSPTSCANP